MADKKDAKGKDAEGKKDKAAEKTKVEKSDTPETAKSRSKLMLFGGIGIVLLAALGVGGFFAYKTFLAKPAASAAAAGHEEAAKEAAGDAHGEAKKDDAHGEAKKDDAHGEAKKDDAHGEAKKDDAHGEAKKDDAHGEAKKDDAHGEAKKEEHGAAEPKKKEGGGMGKIYSLPKMEVNVGGADLARGFVRISVALEFEGDEEQQKELEGRAPQIKDIIITTVSSRHKNDLLAKNGKETLRKDLLNAVNRVAERPIRNVYFTEFLVE